MAGYATVARIEPSQVRIVFVPPPVTADEPPAALDEPTAASPAAPLPERLAEWWGTVREQWAITTFFLFDPESWR